MRLWFRPPSDVSSFSTQSWGKNNGAEYDYHCHCLNVVEPPQTPRTQAATQQLESFADETALRWSELKNSTEFGIPDRILKI